MYPSVSYVERLREKNAKAELIPMIVEILGWFECKQCARCCKNAGIDLSPDEAVEMLRLKGSAYFDMLDTDTIWDRLKAPCGMLNGNLCSIYEKRPLSCRVYPFAWTRPGQLELYQCQMGREVTAGLVKFAEQNGFTIEEVEPEKGVLAMGLDGELVTAAIVPYTLVWQYYESMGTL